MNLESLMKLLGLPGSRANPQRIHEAQLRAMSDRDLADLGMGRSQIPAVIGDESWLTSPGSGVHTGGFGQTLPNTAIIPLFAWSVRGSSSVGQGGGDGGGGGAD